MRCPSCTFNEIEESYLSLHLVLLIDRRTHLRHKQMLTWSLTPNHMLECPLRLIKPHSSFFMVPPRQGPGSLRHFYQLYFHHQSNVSRTQSLAYFKGNFPFRTVSLIANLSFQLAHLDGRLYLVAERQMRGLISPTSEIELREK